MPIYEYRCPDGHTFETFQRMTDPPAEVCEICGKGPVEKLLYPVAVHFKGSGFYTTDYGRGSRKREAGGKEGGESSSTSGDGASSDTGSSSTEKKAAAADSS